MRVPFPFPSAAIAALLLGVTHVQAQQAGAQVAMSVRTETFTVREGTWMSVDITPDTRTIAFELLGDVYTVPAAGGTARALFSGPAFQSQPRYSPDGSRLVFVSDESGTDNLWVANADGSSPRRLSNVPRALMMSPAWSADGATLFATVVRSRVAELWRFDAATGEGAVLVPNSNGPPAPLVSSPAPGPYSAHASADGRWLYYTSVTPRPYGSRMGASSGVVRRALAGGAEERLVLEESFAMAPVTSRDGRWLVYAAQSQGRTGLRVRDLRTETERWLRFPLQRNELEARASRDVLPGYAITAASDAVIVAFDGQLQRITLDTGVASVIPFTAPVTVVLPEPFKVTHRIAQGDDATTVRGRVVQQPALSATGRLAFSLFARLYVRDGARTPQRVTRDSAPREFMPAWSADGRQLAYVTWDREGGQLFTVPASGGAPTRLSRAPALWTDPVWSPDGSAIFALRAPITSARAQPLPVPSDAVVVRVSVRTGIVDTIMRADGMRHPHFAALVAGEAPRLAFSGPAGLVSVRADGTDRRVHLRLPRVAGSAGSPGPFEVRSSPDGTRVLVAAGDRLLLGMRAAEGTAEPPMFEAQTAELLTADSPMGFAWSPASDRVLWVEGATVHTRAVSRGAVAAVQRLEVRLPRAVTSGTLVLRGGRAITMRGTEVIANADIVVVNDRIAAIGARGTVPIPAGARTVDVSGTTIMPGLVDVHAHWQLRRELLEPENPSTYANLAYGVTTIRDPQTFADIFAYADLAAIGTMPSPRIFSTGPGVFAESDFQSLDDARRVLRRYTEDYGTHLLKSYLVGTRQQRQWVVAASRELGLIVTAEGGADSKEDITHALDGFSGNEHALPTAPLYADVVQLLARSGITYTPTLLVSFGGALPIFRLLAQERPASEAKLQRFFPRSELYQRTATRLLAFAPEDYNDAETSAGAAAVLAAGGQVALGGHGEMQGLQNHWEMRLLAQGGMQAHDVLRVATLNGARALGLEADIGSLEPGKLADLLVLDRDPLQDIRHTTAIRYVMLGGALRDGETLDLVAPRAVPLRAPWWREGPSAPSVRGPVAFDERAVDAVVRAELARQRSPGAGVAILRGDQVLMGKGYGMANLEQQVPVTAATMFQSGSLGKMFTAAGVMTMVERGELSLDASIRRYLPDAPATWEAITVRHLLSHTSGIPDYTGDQLDYRRDFTDVQLAELAYTLALEFVPGTRWNYSNTGYVLLGIIISRVSNQPYWALLRERVFTPAGMRRVRVISEREVVPNRASGYRVLDGAFVHQEWVSPSLNTVADGSLLLSVDDLVAWARTVRARGVLSPSSWNAVLSPIRLNSGRTHPYGFGWFLDSLAGQSVLQHSGSWQGFHTQFIRYEESDLTIAVMVNANTTNPIVIASAIAATIDSSLRPPPPPRDAMADTAPALTARVRTMLEKTARSELTISDFEFIRGTTLPRMRSAYGGLLSPLGPLTRLELLSEGTVADDRIRLYRATYGDTRVSVSVRIGPGGGFTGWQLTPLARSP
jgi:CubicO group peptidase (beta-lactamase class C family)/imidazolonepropionase-like amidohydrolase/Tol biopolymer transport system component